MRYVIHAGPQKTGSSYLQSGLLHLRERLRADGIDYPEAWNDYDRLNHKGLVWQLRDRDLAGLQAAFSRLAASGYEVVILSCEGISGLDQERLRMLRTAIGPAETEIVFHCRGWSDRLPSIWNQTTRMGGFATFPDFMLESWTEALRLPRMNYALVWKRFAEVFGRRNVTIVSLDHIRATGREILGHFLQDVVGWRKPFSVPESVLAVNTSSSTGDTEIVRALNHMRARAMGRSDERMADKFFKYRDCFRLEAIEQAMQAETRTLVLDDRASLFAPCHRLVCNWADRLASGAAEAFSLRERTVSFIHPDYLLHPGVTAALETVLADLGPAELASLPTRRLPKAERDQRKAARVAARQERRRLRSKAS